MKSESSRSSILSPSRQASPSFLVDVRYPDSPTKSTIPFDKRAYLGSSAHDDVIVHDFADLPFLPFLPFFADFPFFDDFPFFKSLERRNDDASTWLSRPSMSTTGEARSAAIRPSTKKSPTRDTDFKKILGREEKTMVKNNGVSVVGKSWMEYLRRSLPIRLS